MEETSFKTVAEGDVGGEVDEEPVALLGREEEKCCVFPAVW